MVFSMFAFGVPRENPQHTTVQFRDDTISRLQVIALNSILSKIFSDKDSNEIENKLNTSELDVLASAEGPLFRMFFVTALPAENALSGAELESEDEGGTYLPGQNRFFFK